MRMLRKRLFPSWEDLELLREHAQEEWRALVDDATRAASFGDAGRSVDKGPAGGTGSGPVAWSIDLDVLAQASGTARSLSQMRNGDCTSPFRVVVARSYRAEPDWVDAEALREAVNV